MKIAYFLRSLDLFFAQENKYNSFFAIVPEKSDEERFALAYLKKDRVISIKLNNKKNFSELSNETIITNSNLDSRLKAKNVQYLFLKHSSSNINLWAQAHAVQLLCLPYELREKYEDKIYFEKFLVNHNLPHPKAKVIHNAKELRKIGHAVLQIPNSYGGEGTFFIESFDDYKRQEKQITFPLLMREYQPGLSLSSSIFIEDGRMFLSGVERQCFAKSQNGDLGSFIGIQWLPHQFFSKKGYKTISNELIGIGKHLQLQGLRGLINIDFILNDDQVYFIECNPRVACATNQIIAQKTLTNHVNFAQLLSDHYCIQKQSDQKCSQSLPLSEFAGAQLFFDLNIGVNQKTPKTINTYLPSGFYSIQKGHLCIARIKNKLDFIKRKNIFFYYNELNRNEKYKNPVQFATLISNKPLYDMETGELNKTGTFLYQKINKIINYEIR